MRRRRGLRRRGYGPCCPVGGGPLMPGGSAGRGMARGRGRPCSLPASHQRERRRHSDRPYRERSAGGCDAGRALDRGAEPSGSSASGFRGDSTREGNDGSPAGRKDAPELDPSRSRVGRARGHLGRLGADSPGTGRTAPGLVGESRVGGLTLRARLEDNQVIQGTRERITFDPGMIAAGTSRPGPEHRDDHQGQPGHAAGISPSPAEEAHHCDRSSRRSEPCRPG
jgi:hypothetical protein